MPDILGTKEQTEPTPWLYRARLERVVDGDTLDLTLDLGFRITRKARVRLKDVDTAEIWGVQQDSQEYRQGKVHKAFVTGWLHEAEERVDGEWPLITRTYRDRTGKFGRYLADVIRSEEHAPRADPVTLTDALTEEFGEGVEADA